MASQGSSECSLEGSLCVMMPNRGTKKSKLHVRGQLCPPLAQGSPIVPPHCHQHGGGVLDGMVWGEVQPPVELDLKVIVTFASVALVGRRRATQGGGRAIEIVNLGEGMLSPTPSP